MQTQTPAERSSASASRPLAGDASMAAFPLGGIGTGTVSLGARGELRDWEIFNGPWKGNRLPFTFFAIRAAAAGGEPVTKILESRMRPPYERGAGYEPYDVAGLPRLYESELRGEYPFAWVDFADEDLPVTVRLEAFTPLVPLDPVASGLPAAVLRYRVHNPTDAPVDVTVVGTLFNPIGLQGEAPEISFPLVRSIAGQPSNEFHDDGTLRGLRFGTSLPGDHLKHGTMALVTASPNVTVKPDWRCFWPGTGIDDLWRELSEDGRLSFEGTDDDYFFDSTADIADGPTKQRIEQMQVERQKQRVGSLGVVETLAPGEERTFEFMLAWHFPNRPKAWLDGAAMWEQSLDDLDVVRNHYATLHDDAWAVARHLHAHLSELEAASRAFHASMYGSSLPGELTDAVASTIATLRSNTCFRLEDGTFAGWEGTLDHAGSCAGTCTHVWNYAQTVAFLFPELERSMRRTEFCLETDADGRMNVRAARVFGDAPIAMPILGQPAVDGQLGAIVRLYREWKFSGDDAFLRDLWPGASRALAFAFEHWDADGDFVLGGRQDSMFDIAFYGATPLANALFYAALRAGAEMAEAIGEDELARSWRHAAEQGAVTMDELLWNGEYYVQRLDDLDEHRYQYGDGCLSEQLFGQLLAHVVGLGHVLPADHVRTAIASVHRHNFRTTLRHQRNVARTYALEDEGGLQICTWPHGGKPREPFFFSEEAGWTGSEYQVAAHLIYEGLLDEGLELVRTARARYDGYRRSPWNEIECGHHYARSMSSWALLLAWSGFRYDAAAQAIGFAPADGGDLRCFFSTGSGWGTFAQDADGARLELRWGSLSLAQLDLRLAPGSAVGALRVGERELAAASEQRHRGTRLTFEPVTLAAGDVLAVEVTR